MKQQHEFTETLTLFGIPGVCNVEVTVSFSIPPNEFSPGMMVIAKQELKNATERILEHARKIK